jgi:hypothetical protein
MITVQVSVKRCNRCGEIKPHVDFGAHCVTKDGLRSRCKICCRQDDADRRASDPEKARAKGRAESIKWAKANPEKTRASWRKWYQANADKSNEQHRGIVR